MGFDWQICRGLGVMARAVGLVGHLLEESRRPMASQVWHMVEEEATAHFHSDSRAKAD
jgi:citrate synthase